MYILTCMHRISVRGQVHLQVKDQSTRVWHFILDREVEAPSRFCSIQTFRAVLAIMTQQARSAL